MADISTFLKNHKLPLKDSCKLAPSTKRFADSAQYRIEIPSVEGPKALAAVLAEAKERKVTVHRVSQGSGIMLLSDREIKEMVHMGADHGLEVWLYPEALMSQAGQVIWVSRW